MTSDAARWRQRAEAVERENRRLREALTAIVIATVESKNAEVVRARDAARALLVEGSGVPADNRAKNLGFQKGWPQ